MMRPMFKDRKTGKLLVPIWDAPTDTFTLVEGPLSVVRRHVDRCELPFTHESRYERVSDAGEIEGL